MARNPITARERRGLLAVAVVSLLVTGAGIMVRNCRKLPEPANHTVVVTDEVIDSASLKKGESAPRVKHPRDSAGERNRRRKRSDKKNGRPAAPVSRDFLDGL